MKLAFNKLSFERANTNLLSLTAQVQIAALDDANFETLETTLFAEPNTENKFRFYVRNILQGHPCLVPTAPALNVVNPFVVNNHLAKVRLNYLFTPNVLSETLNVMGGGSSDDEALTKVIAQRRFLTNQPNRKIVDKAHREFLYYLITPEQGATTLALEYEIFYEDGSTKVIEPEGNAIVYFSGTKTICFPTGYYAIEEHEEEDNSIEKWTVRLINQAGKSISERRVFVLADEQDMPTHYLLFRNSYNVFDTIRFDGISTEFFDSDSQTAVSNDTLYELNNEGFTRISINTGRLLPGWINYLRELMLSGEIYLLRNGVLTKVVKQNNKLNMIDYSKINDSTTLEFRLANTNYYF